MYKMEITQIVLKVKTLYPFSIKKISNLKFEKKHIFLLLLLFSCSGSLQAKNIFPKNTYCDSAFSTPLNSTKLFIDYNDNKFKQIINKIPKKVEKNFNLIVFSDPKPSAGYNLKFVKINISKNLMKIYFEDVKPPAGSMTAAVQTHPFCMLEIESLKKYKIFINNKKLN